MNLSSDTGILELEIQSTTPLPSEDVTSIYIATKNAYGHQYLFDEETSSVIEYILVGVLLTSVGVFGVFGNILSILVLMQRKIHASLTVLLIGLSVSDLLVCVLFIVLKGLAILFKDTEYSSFICVPKKYLHPVSQSVQLASTYFTVAITFERFIAVQWPLESKSICTKRRAKILAGLVAVFSFAANSLSFYTHAYRTEIWHSSNMTCESRNASLSQTIKNARLLMYIVVTYLVPLVSVIVVNMIIIKKVHMSNARRETFAPHQLKEIRLTNMLIVVITVYVVCNIFRVLNSVTNNLINATYAELVSLTDFLLIVNSSVNYLIYCAYGKPFRDGFINLFCYCGKDVRRGSEATTMTLPEMPMMRSIRKFSNSVIGTFGQSRKCESNPNPT